MSFERPVIEVNGLSKCYEVYASPGDRLREFLFFPLRKVGQGLFRNLSGKAKPAEHFFQEFWALKNISFAVYPGETLGIIGRNGSGKSTLLQIIAGTLMPTMGMAEVHGRVAALLELGSGFNPEFTGRENVYLSGQVLGLKRQEVDQKFQEIEAFADIGEFIDQPVKTYSSGMFVRLAFAVHAHIDAAIVIIDEALAVGDIFFRQKCYRRLETLRSQGAAIILVSHSMPDIEQYCERAIVLDQGKVHFLGSASEAARHYYLLHQASEKMAPDLDDLVLTDSQKGEEFSPMQLGFPLQPRPVPTSKGQIGRGGATCMSLTLCDEKGGERQAFRQGERVVFFYEFLIHHPMTGIPVGGILIKNERGVIVHGKNSWQFESEPAVELKAGERLLFRHEVVLTLGPGEYVYEVGLSCVPYALWLNRKQISHDDMSAAEQRICHVSDAGMFSLGLAVKLGVQKLSHHGIADLEGKLLMGRVPPREDRPSEVLRPGASVAGGQEHRL